MNQEEALNRLMEMFPSKSVLAQKEYWKMDHLDEPFWEFMIYIAAEDINDRVHISSRVGWEECFAELERSYSKEKINESK